MPKKNHTDEQKRFAAVLAETNKQIQEECSLEAQRKRLADEAAALERSRQRLAEDKVAWEEQKKQETRNHGWDIPEVPNETTSLLAQQGMFKGSNGTLPKPVETKEEAAQPAAGYCSIM